MSISAITPVALGSAENYVKALYFSPMTFVGKGAFASNSGTSATLSVPSGSAAGDLLVAVFFVRDACNTITGFNWNTWDSVGNECAHLPANFGLYGTYLLTRSKIHSGSESSVTIGYSASGTPTMCGGVMLAFRGGHQTTPIGATNYGGLPHGMSDASPITPIYGPALSATSSHLCLVARGKSSSADGGLSASSNYVNSYTSLGFESTLAGDDLSLFMYLGANYAGRASSATDSSGSSLTYTGTSAAYTQVSLELLHNEYVMPPGE
jgi:hypothetical protein